MMAIIGFIFLLFVAGVFFLGGLVVLFAGGSLGGDSGSSEGLASIIIGGIVLWLAFHFAPFTIHFTGA